MFVNISIYTCTVDVLQFQTLFFLFSNKMLVIRAGIHIRFIQKKSDLGLHSLSGPFLISN